MLSIRVAFMKRLYFSCGLEFVKNVLDASWFKMEIGLSTWMLRVDVILDNSSFLVEMVQPRNSKNKIHKSIEWKLINQDYKDCEINLPLLALIL